MNLPPVFARYRSAIEGELRQVLAERQSALYDMMRYHLGWMDENGNLQEGAGGKVLRPTLCLLACEAVGAEFQKALPAAAAIELVHNFSLIHDDIQDDDRERHHRSTVWSIWGKPQAINAGTAMHILADLALRRLDMLNVPARMQLCVQRLIDESTLTLIEGQYLDISYESRFDITVANYLDMIERKTAALIACSLEAGALLGSDNEQLAKNMADIGRNLGLAFQIRDDILGIWSSHEETGKPQGSDIKHRKKTLPIVYALEETKDGLRTEMINAYRNGSLDDGDLATVLRILEAVNARFQAQEMAEMYRDKALEALDRLELVPSAKHDLEELARFLVERNF